MFDLKSYRKACDRMTLDAEKIEEMIAMSENMSKKSIRRPARMAAVAAALVAALGITASAAELPAVKEFFATVFVTVTTNDGKLADMSIPTMAVEERDGRTFLILDEEEIDVTDALNRDGKYVHKGGDYTVEVDESGCARMTVLCGEDGEVMTFTTKPNTKGEAVNYDVITGGENGVQTGTYEVVSSGMDGVQITGEDGDTYNYFWEDGRLVPEK